MMQILFQSTFVAFIGRQEREVKISSRRKVCPHHIQVTLSVVSTHRMFQSPYIYWEMCTQKKNAVIASFESDIVWLKGK